MPENQIRHAKSQLEEEIATYGDKALRRPRRSLAPACRTNYPTSPLREVYAEFENGFLTGDEAIQAFELMGELEMAETVRQRIAIEEEMDPTGAYANDNEIEL